MLITSPFYNLDLRRPPQEENMRIWVRKLAESKFPIELLNKDNCFVFDSDLVSRLTLQHANIEHTVVVNDYRLFDLAKSRYIRFPLLKDNTNVLKLKLNISKEALKDISKNTDIGMYNNLIVTAMENGDLKMLGSVFFLEEWELTTPTKVTLPSKNIYQVSMQGVRLQREVAEKLIRLELELK